MLYIAAKNSNVRNIILIISSLFFYAFGEPLIVLLMMASIVCNYLFGLVMDKPRYKRHVLTLAIIFNLLLLVIFKYLGLLTVIINSFLDTAFPVPKITLPIGISFFTFQAISYVIDVYRDKSLKEKNILNIFLYISFFPQLMAGPINKFNDMAPQIRRRVHSVEKTIYGIKRFVYGFAKKVIISDALGLIADNVFDNLNQGISMPAAWTGIACYMFQIFFDFSGYSDMAIGLAKLFGFDFRENFNYPYAALSMTDFWRRWNISVSTWFKEYVYIPLGGNRLGILRTNINKMIVFFLTGLWHGANFTFIAWGLLHGLFLTLENFNIIPVRKAKKFFSKCICNLYVLLVSGVTFAVFRAETLQDGFYIIKQMFSGSLNPQTNQDALIFGQITPYIVFLFIAGFIVSLKTVPALSKYLRKKNYTLLVKTASYIVPAILYLLCILNMSSSSYSPFIYFRF